MGDRPFKPIESGLDEAGGSFEKMLRRFVKRVRDGGLMPELMLRRSFIKPSAARRRKQKRRDVTKNVASRILNDNNG